MGLNKFINVTVVVTNTSYTVKSGARAIDMKNTGSGTAYWTGDGAESVPVSLSANEQYSFPGNDLDTFKAVTIDATGTIVELSIFY